MLYIKLFIEREKNIGQSAPECPFKDTYCAEWLLYIMSLTYGTHLCGKRHTVCAMSTPLCHIANLVNTIRYDIVYLTYTKELTCSQLSPSHRTNWKIKEKELKINREASVWSVPVVMKAVQGRRSIKVGRICWKGRLWAGSEDDDERDDNDRDELLIRWYGLSRLFTANSFDTTGNGICNFLLVLVPCTNTCNCIVTHKNY